MICSENEKNHMTGNMKSSILGRECGNWKRAFNGEKKERKKKAFPIRNILLFKCLSFISRFRSTAYGINEERVLAVLIRRNLIAMNELIVIEIKDEKFRWANLRRCCQAYFTRINNPQALAIINLQSQEMCYPSIHSLVEYFMRKIYDNKLEDLLTAMRNTEIIRLLQSWVGLACHE